MALRTDTVNRDALGYPLVDVVDHALSDLGVVCNVKVVVVDIELRVGVGGAGGTEGDANKVLSEHTAEHAVAEVAILGEDLVDNVPLEDLALVPCDHGGDVVLDDRRQCGAVADLGNPARQLRVPEQCVATDVFVVLLRPVYDCVGVGESKLSALGCA